MKWIRRIVIVLAALAIVALLVVAFRPKPARVEVATVERGEFVEWVEEPGRTRVRDRFVVSAPLSGELARVTKKAGDTVAAGEQVAFIRPTPPAMLDARTREELEGRARAARSAHTLAVDRVERARVVEAHATRELERIRALAQRQALTEREFESAQLEVEVARRDVRAAELSAKVAEHELAVARAAVGAAVQRPSSERRWTVVSPLAGRVLRVLAANEGAVAAGTPLFELADTTELEVVVSMLTTDAVRVAPNARVSIERWGGSPLEGRVRTVEPSGYTKLSALGVEEQRVDVLVDIVSAPQAWSVLGDSFRVHTRTVVRREPAVLKTAASALFRDKEGWAVFLVEDGRARKWPVQVEARSGAEAMLGEGIVPGMTVIVFPSNALADGARVAWR
jgi:HlyD family secretion protein